MSRVAAALTCGRCSIPVRPGKEHDHPEDCIAALLRTKNLILEKIGKPGSCRGCGATIYWITCLDGKAKPYDSTLVSHFHTCPQREQFYSKKG